MGGGALKFAIYVHLVLKILHTKFVKTVIMTKLITDLLTTPSDTKPYPWDHEVYNLGKG
jgi:hypothetical protein